MARSVGWKRSLITAGPMTRNAVAENAVRTRKMKKAAILGASAVPMEQRRKITPVAMQD